MGLFSLSAAAQFSPRELGEVPLSGPLDGSAAALHGPSAASDFGYFVAVLGSAPFDSSRRTHVLVVSRGGSAGTLFQIAASGRGKRYAEVFPEHQVVLLVANELDGERNVKLLEKWGYRVLAKRTWAINVEMVAREVSAFKEVASFDLFSHANYENGARIGEDFLNIGTREFDFLRSRFWAKAWATLHGCNTGWRVAPYLAKQWRVPVAGSFTGTHFERLHSTLDFFPYEKELAPPGPWAPKNALSYWQEAECTLTGCVRMHPDPYAYWGEHGRYRHGLGFYRFFCSGLKRTDCEARMALSLTGFIGLKPIGLNSSIEDFYSVLQEYMCPINATEDVRGRCRQQMSAALTANDFSYTPFKSRSSVCGESSCWEARSGETSIEFMSAVTGFLRGWASLAAQPAKP